MQLLYSRNVERNFVLACLTTLFFFLGNNLYFMLPKFIKELGGTETQVGLIAGAPGIVSVFMIPLTGILATRYGRKTFIVGGTGILIFVSLFYTSINSLNMSLFILLRIFHGLAFSFFFVANGSFAGDYSPGERRVEFLSYYGAFVIGPHLIAPWLGEWASSTYGFWMMFVIASAFFTISLLFSIAFKEDEPSKFEDKRALSMIRGYKLSSHLILSFFLGCVFSVLFFFLPLYGKARGIKVVGPFYTLYGISIIIVRLTLGRFMDRIRAQRSIPCLFLLIGISVYVLSVGKTLSVFLFSAIIYGFGEGLTYPALNAGVIDRIPKELISKGMGLYMGAFNIGTLIAPPVFGKAVEAFGYYPAFLMLVAICILGILFGRRV